MNKILALDDDEIILTLLKTLLPEDRYDLNCFSSGIDAVNSIENEHYDLIISDLMMPVMNGQVFYSKVKKMKPDIPFIFLTANDDLDTVIELMKLGADDYLKKPIKVGTLFPKIERLISEKKRELLLQKIREDEIIEKKQKESIVSWKELYSGKESTQANRLLNFLSRNIEHAGGFVWLDLLKQELSDSDSEQDSMMMSKSLLNLITESAEYIQKIIYDLTYINTLMSAEFPIENISLNTFLDNFKTEYELQGIPVAAKYKKRISLNTNSSKKDYILSINKDNLFRICRELLFNSIKYSPENSKIIIFFDVNSIKDKYFLDISFWNNPVEASSADAKGKKVTGIPYEYSENVFDLFYTIDKFPTRIPEEEWSQGIGLYVAREMLKKMNSEIHAQNVVMHTLEKSDPYVKVNILIPLTKAEQ